MKADHNSCFPNSWNAHLSNFCSHHFQIEINFTGLGSWLTGLRHTQFLTILERFFFFFWLSTWFKLYTVLYNFKVVHLTPHSTEIETHWVYIWDWWVPKKDLVIGNYTRDQRNLFIFVLIITAWLLTDYTQYCMHGKGNLVQDFNLVCMISNGWMIDKKGDLVSEPRQTDKKKKKKLNFGHNSVLKITTL